MIQSIANTTQIIVSGHRGYKSEFPENTLLAFQQAIKLGVHMLELDLRMSKDYVIVVIHDDTVDRTTNGSGQVRELTFDQLQQLDAGSWMGPCFAGLKIPSFEQFCQLMSSYPNVLLNIEIKPSEDAIATADGAVDLLKQHGLYEQAVFTSFDANVLAHLYDCYGAKTQGFRGDKLKHFVEGVNGTYSKMWAIAFEMSLLSRSEIDAFRQMGLQVWSYCPDNEQDVLYSIGCGATVMTCNNPVPALRIKQLLEQ